MSSSQASDYNRKDGKGGSSTSVNRSQSITLATLKSTLVSHIMGSGKSIGIGSETRTTTTTTTTWTRKESAHAWLSCYADTESDEPTTSAALPKSFASGRRVELPPLNSKEIYRLKASWNSALETHGSIKEAGLVTILWYVDVGRHTAY